MSTATKPPFVGMAQIVLLQADQSAVAVLGSCLGLAVYSLRDQCAAFAHTVLPARDQREGPPGKFIDSAIPAMVELLARAGAAPNRLAAKVAGGASMFRSSGPIQVGAANAECVVQLLKEHRIPLAAADFGGHAGRRVVFHCARAQLQVEIAGASAYAL